MRQSPYYDLPERRRIQAELIYLHKDKITDLIANNPTLYLKDDARAFCNLIMRKELKYSPKTATVDIWLTVLRIYRQFI
jgi:hypothetical protein